MLKKFVFANLAAPATGTQRYVESGASRGRDQTRREQRMSRPEAVGQPEPPEDNGHHDRNRKADKKRSQGLNLPSIYVGRIIQVPHSTRRPVYGSVLNTVLPLILLVIQ